MVADPPFCKVDDVGEALYALKNGSFAPRLQASSAMPLPYHEFLLSPIDTNDGPMYVRKIGSESGNCPVRLKYALETEGSPKKLHHPNRNEPLS